MFARIERSFALAGQCWDVLNEDRALLIFPILSVGAMALAFVSFALPIWVAFGRHGASFGGPGNTHYLFLVLFYFFTYSVAAFFNTALISVALKRFDGIEASVGDGISVALSRLPAILGYCLVGATVGALLRMIEERVGLIGRIIVGIFGFTFSVATTLVIPIIADTEEGPFAAIGESMSMMKRTWGENIIGNAGIGAVTGLLTVLVAIVGGALVILAGAHGHAGLAVLFGILLVGSIAALMLISSALHAIYSAALYRFAKGGTAGRYFDDSLLGAAYGGRN